MCTLFDLNLNSITRWLGQKIKFKLLTNCNIVQYKYQCIYLDVLQINPASSLVLQTHQLLCVLVLLFGLSVKELCKIRQGFIIPLKVIGLKMKTKRKM